MKLSNTPKHFKKISLNAKNQIKVMSSPLFSVAPRWRLSSKNQAITMVRLGYVPHEGCDGSGFGRHDLVLVFVEWYSAVVGHATSFDQRCHGAWIWADLT